MADGTITHIAGTVVHVNTLMRQRCGWCGAVLIDENLDHVMVMSDDPARASVPTWEVGTFVAVSGAASWQIPARATCLTPPARAWTRR